MSTNQEPIEHTDKLHCASSWRVADMGELSAARFERMQRGIKIVWATCRTGSPRRDAVSTSSWGALREARSAWLVRPELPSVPRSQQHPERNLSKEKISIRLKDLRAARICRFTFVIFTYHFCRDIKILLQPVGPLAKAVLPYGAQSNLVGRVRRKLARL